MDAAPRDSNKGRKMIVVCIVICFGAVDVLALLIRVLVAGKRYVGMGRLEDRGIAWRSICQESFVGAS